MTYIQLYEVFLAQKGEPAVTHSTMFKTTLVKEALPETWAARLIADGNVEMITAELHAEVLGSPPYHREKKMRHALVVTELGKSLLELGKATVARLGGAEWFEIAELQEEAGNISCYIIKLPSEQGEWLNELTESDSAFQLPLIK